MQWYNHPVNNERKRFPWLLAIGFSLLLIPPLIIFTLSKWLESQSCIEFVIGILLVSIFVGPVLMFVDLIKSTVQGIQGTKSKIKWVIFQLLALAVVPTLVYFGINPVINNSLFCRTEFVNDLLIVSTVLLGFTITIGGVRFGIKKEISKDDLDNRFLNFAESCLCVSLVIGFNTVFWILRWLVVGGDPLLNWVVALFSGQTSLIFVSSSAYVFSRIYYRGSDGN